MLKIIKLVFICFMSVSINSFAAPSLQDYGNLPVVSMVAISPDGDKVAFRRVENGNDILAITSLRENKVLAKLDVSEIRPHQLKFLNNDQIYLVVSEFTRVWGFIGKFDNSTGFVFDINTKKFRQLLVAGEGNVYPAQSGLGFVVGVSADGQYAFMPAFTGKPDMSGLSNPARGLLKVKLKEKGRPRIVAKGSSNSTNFFVSKNGNVLAEERFDGKENLHSILVKKNNVNTAIFEEKTDIRNKVFMGITKDEKSLVFIENNSETNHHDYYLMSIETGNIQNTNLGRKDADIDAVIEENNQVIAGVVYSGFIPLYKFFDMEIDEKYKRITEKFPEQSVRLESFSPDWKHIIVSVEGSQFSGDYFLFSDGKAPVFITSRYPNITSADMNPIGKITYTARDDLKIQTLLTIPKDKISNMKNLPAIIYPHGGPAAHDTIGFDFFAQAMASQGYLVVQPQFRGSTGFGTQHTLAGHGEWGKKMQDDLTDAVHFFTKKGIIDPNRVCIMGISYGGYAALAGAAFTPDLYKCAVSINGIGNVYDMLQWDRSRNGESSEIAAYMEEQFGRGEIDKNELAKMSPEEYAHQVSAPILLIHSQNDQRVPFSQSSSMHKALKKAKKSSELVQLKGDNHNLVETETRLQALEATVNFVNKHLK